MMCSVQLAVTLHSPASGRYMDLHTNMPGLQFYSGNNLNGSTVGKGAYPYPIYGGLALETQVGTSILLLWPCLVCQVWRTSCGGPQSTIFKHALLCLCAAGLA